MSEEERAAKLEREKQQDEVYNDSKRRALNKAKHIVLKYFPRVMRLQIGQNIRYDFSLLGHKRDKDEVERLQPNPKVNLTYEW